MSNFLPVYVQTTTRVFGYFSGPEQYDALTAQAYIGAFISVLDDPAAVNLSGVPAANLSPPNGAGQAFSFTYIDAQAAAACGIAPGANFLNVAVAGNGMSGDIPLARLRAAFNNLLPRNVPNGRYLFAIIDHNAAHHFSIPFIEYAFRTANSEGLQRQRLIIILDQHSDIGAGQQGNAIARCDNWGGLALKVASIADLYLHTGWAPRTETAPVNIAQQYCETNVSAGPYIMTRVIPPDPTNTLVNAVIAGFPGLQWNTTDVYITWDRDSVQGSLTPWGDGMYDSLQLGQEISLLATTLTQAGGRLVGVDVVGLPSQGGYSQRFRNLQPAPALADARTSVMNLLNAVRALAP